MIGIVLIANRIKIPGANMAHLNLLISLSCNDARIDTLS